MLKKVRRWRVQVSHQSKSIGGVERVSPSSCAEPAQTAVHEGFIREGVEEFFRLL
ncbi:MAG: hypothetical protein QW797_07290 [Thermoproteota archaeon]